MVDRGPALGVCLAGIVSELEKTSGPTADLMALLQSVAGDLAGQMKKGNQARATFQLSLHQ